MIDFCVCQTLVCVLVLAVIYRIRSDFAQPKAKPGPLRYRISNSNCEGTRRGQVYRFGIEKPEFEVYEAVVCPDWLKLCCRQMGGNGEI